MTCPIQEECPDRFMVGGDDPTGDCYHNLTAAPWLRMTQKCKDNMDKAALRVGGIIGDLLAATRSDKGKQP